MKDRKTMNKKRRIGIVVVAIVAVAMFSGCVDKEAPVATPTPSPTPTPIVTPTLTPTPKTTTIPEYNSALVRNYEIVKIEDISTKVGSQLNIRKAYRIVVSSDISKEELKATLIQVVMDKTSENSDIDEVIVFAYDRKEDADSIYTFGKVEWCPNGDWGGVTSIIASTNDRSSYKYTFDIKDKVGSIDTSDRPTEREFEIYNALEEALWEDLDTPEEIIEERVAKKYGISKEELDRIWIKVTAYKMK